VGPYRGFSFCFTKYYRICLLGADYTSRVGTVGRTGSVWRDISTVIKRNKNQLCDYITTEPPRLAGIRYRDVGISPNRGRNLPCNHVHRASPAYQARSGLARLM
jgi:hypothetical protein